MDSKEDAEANDYEFTPVGLQYKDKNFVFDILLDHRYPFYQPQIFCRSVFSHPPLNDGRDIFSEVVLP
jgi:ubiquitin-protein ligase